MKDVTDDALDVPNCAECTGIVDCTDCGYGATDLNIGDLRSLKGLPPSAVFEVIAIDRDLVTLQSSIGAILEVDYEAMEKALAGNSFT